MRLEEKTCAICGKKFTKRSYAVAASDLLIKGHEKSDIQFGDSFTDDKFSDEKFDYLLKEKRRRGKIQLLDAREIYMPMRRSLGDKRRKIGDGEDGESNQIADIVKAYGSLEEWRLAEWFDRNDKRLGFKLLASGQHLPFVPEGARLEISVI